MNLDISTYGDGQKQILLDPGIGLMPRKPFDLKESLTIALLMSYCPLGASDFTEPTASQVTVGDDQRHSALFGFSNDTPFAQDGKTWFVGNAKGTLLQLAQQSWTGGGSRGVWGIGHLSQRTSWATKYLTSKHFLNNELLGAYGDPAGGDSLVYDGSDNRCLPMAAQKDQAALWCFQAYFDGDQLKVKHFQAAGFNATAVTTNLTTNYLLNLLSGSGGREAVLTVPGWTRDDGPPKYFFIRNPFIAIRLRVLGIGYRAV